MLKEYEYDGSTWQFEEDRAPAGAVLIVRGAGEGPIDEAIDVDHAVDVDQAESDDKKKAVETLDKSRSASNKGV